MEYCIHRIGGDVMGKNKFADVKEPVTDVAVSVKNLRPEQISLCAIIARNLAGEPVQLICLYPDKNEATCPIPQEFK